MDNQPTREKCISCAGTGNIYRHDEDEDFLPCDDCKGTGLKPLAVIPPVEGIEADKLILEAAEWMRPGAVVQIEMNTTLALVSWINRACRLLAAIRSRKGGENE